MGGIGGTAATSGVAGEFDYRLNTPLKGGKGGGAEGVGMTLDSTLSNGTNGTNGVGVSTMGMLTPPKPGGLGGGNGSLMAGVGGGSGSGSGSGSGEGMGMGMGGMNMHNGGGGGMGGGAMGGGMGGVGGGGISSLHQRPSSPLDDPTWTQEHFPLPMMPTMATMATAMHHHTSMPPSAMNRQGYQNGYHQDGYHQDGYQEGEYGEPSHPHDGDGGGGGVEEEEEDDGLLVVPAMYFDWSTQSWEGVVSLGPSTGGFGGVTTGDGNAVVVPGARHGDHHVRLFIGL